MTKRKKNFKQFALPPRRSNIYWKEYQEGTDFLRCCPMHIGKRSHHMCIVQPFLQWATLWLAFQNESRYLKIIPKNMFGIFFKKLQFTCEMIILLCNTQLHTFMYSIIWILKLCFKELGGETEVDYLSCISKIIKSWKTKLLMFVCYFTQNVGKKEILDLNHIQSSLTEYQEMNNF